MQAFQEGGATMYGILCMALFAHVLGLAALGVSLFSKKGKGGAPLAIGSGALLFGVVSMLIGVVGYLWGMSRVDDALLYADSSQAELMRAVGRAEAMNNIYFGCCATVFPVVAGLAAIIVGVRKRRQT